MDRDKTVSTARMTSRMLLGMMMIAAAVLKLMSIDLFEIYIYSFNIFSYAFSAVIARMVIAAEILLGSGLTLKIFYRQTWRLTMLMMTGFTLFLGYAIIFRSDDNCHCFGDLISLNPSESIYKNIISIFILLFVRRESDHAYKPVTRRWLTGISIAAAVITPFAAFPTDSLYNRLFSKSDEIDTVEFENVLDDRKSLKLLRFESHGDSTAVVRDTIAAPDLSDGRHIVSFISAGCGFCKTGAKKLAAMVEKNGIDPSLIKVFAWGYDADIVEFMRETNTAGHGYWFIDPLKSLDITHGRFPVYVWVDGGEIVGSGDMRDLDEDRIRDFLKQRHNPRH